jgi:hypothetical protein
MGDAPLPVERAPKRKMPPIRRPPAPNIRACFSIGLLRGEKIQFQLEKRFVDWGIETLNLLIYEQRLACIDFF